jgi:uncharacterized protein (TIGR02246 family)
MSAPAATAASTSALFDAYGTAWAERDPDLIASFHAPAGTFHLHAGAEPVAGREAIRDAFAGFLAQFPDLAFAEQEKLLADWGWAVRWTMSGTLALPFDTGSAVAPPGGRIEVDAVDVITVADGLLTAKHTYLDWPTALRQLGLEGSA